MDADISPQELKQLMASGQPFFLLDVRSQEEYDIANLGGTLIPLGELPDRFQELNPNHHIVVHCHHGTRSAFAVEFLRSSGYAKTQNLSGGIDLWSEEIDRSIPRY